MPQIDAARIRRKTNRIKAEFAELEALCPEQTAAGVLVRSIHRRLNSLARLAAEAFPEEEAVTFSGGTDKPKREGEREDDED